MTLIEFEAQSGMVQRFGRLLIGNCFFMDGHLLDAPQVESPGEAAIAASGVFA